MAPHELIDQLAVLQQDMERAAEELDWSKVAEVDRQIRDCVRDISPEDRQGELAEMLGRLKMAYQQVIEKSDKRRAVLQKKMSKIRKNKDAMGGYKASLAAGNREVRANA